MIRTALEIYFYATMEKYLLHCKLCLYSITEVLFQMDLLKITWIPLLLFAIFLTTNIKATDSDDLSNVSKKKI